jgi:hypothetical protein
MTDRLLQLKTGEARGTFVRLEVVVEVRFTDIQQSTRYPCGMALRFAPASSASATTRVPVKPTRWIRWQRCSGADTPDAHGNHTGCRFLQARLPKTWTAGSVPLLNRRRTSEESPSEGGLLLGMKARALTPCCRWLPLTATDATEGAPPQKRPAADSHRTRWYRDVATVRREPAERAACAGRRALPAAVAAA